jgi:hypothetical protein
MSMEDKASEFGLEAADAVTELSRKAGYSIPSNPYGIRSQAEMAIDLAEKVAPQAVDKVVYSTDAIIKGATAGLALIFSMPVATALAPYAVIAGTGLAAYGIYKKFFED